MEEKKGIPWKKIGSAIVETIKAIGYGDILLRLRVDKSLPYTFANFDVADVLITNADLPDELAQLAADNNVRVINVSE